MQEQIANTVGFNSFNGMLLYFTFLLCMFLIGYGIYKSQKEE